MAKVYDVDMKCLTEAMNASPEDIEAICFFFRVVHELDSPDPVRWSDLLEQAKSLIETPTVNLRVMQIVIQHLRDEAKLFFVTNFHSLLNQVRERREGISSDYPETEM